MQIKQILRYQLVYVLLVILLVAAVIFNINTGNINISPIRIFRIIFLKDYVGTPEYNIIWKIRLPRLCMAAILGGALSLSGFLLQTFFRNPIAGPFVLGISSGAKMFVAITMIFLLKYVSGMPLWAQIAAAFIGSLFAMLYVLLFANKVKSMSMLLVVGIMISYICSAITDLCITFANDSDIANLTHWAMGSFSGSSWTAVKLAAIVVFPTSFITFYFQNQLMLICWERDMHRVWELISDFQGVYSNAVEYAFCLCYSTCRPDIVCGDSSSAYYKIIT